ncbi:MAG: hypothetical protein ABFD58_06315 [Anaerolineaceae bacterium]
MKIKISYGTNGKVVRTHTPENEEDIHQLELMQLRGEIDATDYMHGETKEEFEYEMRKEHERMKRQQEKK